MSILAVDPDVFKWLQSIDIVKEGKRNSENKVQLPEVISSKFFDGLYISKILRKIIENQSEINENLLGKMKSIKQNSTPAIRLYNWNLIADVLKYYKYAFDYVQKSKILNLQPAPLQKILAYLKGIHKNQNGVKKDDSTVMNQSSLSSIKDKQTIGNPLQVDIKTISAKNLTDAKNIMQFFVISLSKNFKLSPQHTLNLFLDNNKYLAHLLVKGIKESFQPIIMFQNQVLSNLEFIILSIFSTDEEKSIQFFFEGLKPCLISKNLDVASKCLNILQKTQEIYSNNKLSKQCLVNLLRKDGINTLLFSSKRHQSTLQQAIQLSYKFMEDQLFEFIRPSQKSPFWNNDIQKLNFYSSFLFVAQNHILKAFQASTCLIEWNKYLLKSLKRLKGNSQIKILIKILHRTWIQFPSVFQQDNGLAEGLLAFLKTTSFSSDFMVFIDSIKVMFDLMQVLGKRKNSNAPVFYKTLINCFSYQSSQQRVIFIIDNFIEAFRQIQNLPGSILVEPLIKSIQRNCTTSSLNLCKILIMHEKVKEDQVLQILDVMTKVFFEDANFGSLAIEYVFECIPFLDTQLQGQFLIKNSQLCLAHFYSLSKSIKATFQDLMQTLKQYPHDESVKQVKGGFLGQVRKYLIIENLMKFLREIVHKDYFLVKQEIQESIFMTYIKVKNELRKQEIALILKNLIMKKYYDIEEQLIAVIDKYEHKYFAYFEPSKRSISILESEQDSPIKENSVKQSRLYASKSLIIGESQVKKIRADIFKPQKSALQHLQKLKQKMSKLRLISQQNQKKHQSIQQKKDQIFSIIKEKRLVRYGAKYNSDLEYRALFEFDSVKSDKGINGLPIIQLTNLKQQEEDIFVADVQSFVKKYRKVWRFLFFKYSSFGSRNSTQTKIQEKIHMAQVWKMHRQYNADFVKKEDCFTLVRLVNDEMKRKSDLQHLTYLGFEEYIVQFCIFAYNKIGLSNLSPGQKVAKLINQFRSVTQEKGGNVDMFSNPEEVYFLETDVIKEFNRRLIQNPDYILPQGYKKFKLTEFVYDYEFTQPTRSTFQHVNKKFCFKKSYFDVMEVLDMIFSECPALGFHIMQPKTTKVDKTLAKPALFQQLTQKMKSHKEGYLMPKREINSTYIALREKVNPIKPQFHPLIEFSLGIKLGLAAVPVKYKYIGEQVAYWMDDMLDAVENGSTKVLNKAHKQIDNDAIKRKRQYLYKLKSDRKEKQQLYKQRSQSVKQEFEKIQVIKQQTHKSRIEKMKAKRVQEKLRQEKEMKKKLSEFQKAKRYFTQKQQTQKQKSIKEQQSKKVEKEEYKKKVQEYFKLKKQQLQQKQLNWKKEKEYQSKKQKEEKEKKKQLEKKMHLQVLKKDELALQRNQQIKDKYVEFINQSIVQEQFQLHRKSLSLLFQLLVKYQKSKISATQKNQISQATFNFFTIKFKIIPFILEKNILSKIFLSIGKDQSNKAGFGLSYKGFEQALLKMIIKAKITLNLMAERRKGASLNKSSVSILNTNEEELDNSFLNKSLLEINKSSLDSSKLTSSKLAVNQGLGVEFLFDPEGITKQTIRQFMLFLNLPDDKLGIEQRFREAIESKNTKPTALIRKQLKQEIINV